MILNKIALAAKARVEKEKKEIPLLHMQEKAQALACSTGFPFEKALQKEGISYICEIKKASPSKGLIAPDFPFVRIAKEYEQAGASAVSVLTEPQFFLGSDAYLTKIKQAVHIPVLRKDFTIDPYQIYQAKVLGANAVLLLCALLDLATLKAYIALCGRLGLSALVEAHTKEEVAVAVKAGARVIGINNRDLQTFTVNLNTCLELRRYVPATTLFIAESGIKTAKDIEKLRAVQADGVLIGETLMRAADKAAMLTALNGGAR